MKSKSPKFQRGQQVEVCSKELGFESSYFPATIITEIDTEYVVQFNTLLGDDDNHHHFPRTLREFRPGRELRPVPPEEVGPGAGKFQVSDIVDAYANDGWWKGVVVKVLKSGGGGGGGGGRGRIKYRVEFERGGGEVEVGDYVGHCLRVHRDWLGAHHWVISKTHRRSVLVIKK
ncbi:hypothetical protein vseg_017605 [Gypsophila vaccaria]